MLTVVLCCVLLAPHVDSGFVLCSASTTCPQWFCVLCLFAGGLPGPKGMVAEDLPQVSNTLLFSIGGAEDLPQVSNSLQYIAV